MEQTLTEQVQKTLEEKISVYNNLANRERSLQKWLKKAEEEQYSVNTKTYRKVKDGYESQLKEIKTEMAPIEDEIASVRESTATQLSALDRDLEALEEQHAESMFRHRVGEYGKDKLKEIEGSLLPQMEEKRKQKESLSRIMEQIDSAVSWEPNRTREAVDNGLTSDKENASEDSVDEKEHTSRADDIISELADPSDESAPADPTDSRSWETSKDSFDKYPEYLSANEHPVKDAAANSKSEDNDRLIPFPNLIITSGSQSNMKIPLLPTTMTIGREHDNNIELKDEEVSRYHSKVIYREGQFILQDLNSSTGTWVNNEKITETALKNSDRIRLGKTEMMIDFS